MRLRRIAFTAVAVSAVLASLAPGIASADEEVTSTIDSGPLSLTTQPISFTTTALTGANATITASPALPWSVVDARGTGEAWTATISSTALTSAAGDTESTVRTIAVGQLSMTDGTITPAAGADPTDNITPTGVTLSGSGQTFIASSGTSKGTYTFSPTLSLAIPANAYRANYTTGTSGGKNPYTSTLTLTIS